MNLHAVRKILLWAFIGFLSLTALIAIVSVLNGPFGEMQLKVLATTFTISAASICAMSCAAFAEKRRAPAGFAGMILAAAAAIMAITGIWREMDNEEFWKTTVVLIVISVACAHALLLLIPNLAANHRWTQIAACVFIAALAFQIVFAVCKEIRSEGYYRWLAVVSIIVVLLTLIVPVCAKLGGKQAVPSERLVLSKISDGLYTDQSGRKLRVTEIETGNWPEA